MRPLSLLCPLLLLCASAVQIHAQTPAPKFPQLNDPALRLEKLVTFPDVEACTTVCADPSGAFYVGNDPRDTRLNTAQPECSIVRFSSMGADRKRTVFADKLYSPAGSAWHDGWLYVIHDPLMSRFKDTDGDGVADVREDLITNLGLQPYEGLNDHVVSGFTLGMDGFFYISVGDRGIYKAKGKDGRELTMRGGGIIRVRPDGTGLEIFSTGTRNHLAVCLDAEDNAFTLDNTDDGNGWWTRLTHHIEGGYYGYPYDYQHAPNYGVTQPSRETLEAIKRNGGKVDGGSLMVDGGKTAAADPSTNHNPPSTPLTFLPAMADFGGGSPTGGLCYLSDGLPEQYRGKLFFSEWGKGSINVIEVARDGATFRFVKNTPLIQGGNGIDFRPMQLSVAADGSLLIADWGWGGWKSPKQLGTIWRLSWPEAKPAPRRADERKASVDELIAALGHPDRDQRLRAQWALARTCTHTFFQKKDRSIFDKVGVIARDENASVESRSHALWTFPVAAISIAVNDPVEFAGDRVKALFEENIPLSSAFADPRLRSQAVRADVRIYNELGLVASRVIDASELVTDSSVIVRLQAAGMRRASFSLEPAYLEHLMADSDPFVRFVKREALEQPFIYSTDDFPDAYTLIYKGDDLIYKAARESGTAASQQAWSVLGKVPSVGVVLRLSRLSDVRDASTRAQACGALASVAYQPKPYDGHWWGTQPVKNPPPLPSVAWAGTAKALEALTAALTDENATVRLAAAKAFSGFLIGDEWVAHAPSRVVSGAPAGNSSTTGEAADQKSDASRAGNESSAGAPKTTREGARATHADAALAALRARLSAETDAAVRRQLIESLGVQRDPKAMSVFTQIALDEKADAEFRDTAIGAVVSIGGDEAKKIIAQLASAKISPTATRKIIAAAGELRVLEAAPAMIGHLADDDAGNRLAAVKALAQLGPKANATQPLVAALSDSDDKVKQAAVEALGALRDPAALPALIEFAKTRKYAREVITAIAAMPDPQSIPVLVNALRDNNSGVRRPALKALKTMREAALPRIEEMLASGKIPREFEPEIRAAFDSGAIVKWKMTGPFENVWGAVHPPEKDVLAAAWPMTESPTGNIQRHPPADYARTLLAKRYTNAEGREVGWRDVSASADDGRVNLEKEFHSNGMVCAYAYADIESPEVAVAKLLCGSDDQIAVWLNGVKVHDSGPGSRGYTADQDTVPLRLVGGTNQLLVKIGNAGGGWEFNARIPGLDGGKFVKPKGAAPDEKQRAFALAQNADGTWQHAGDSKNGAKIFHDPNGPLGGICAQCHKVRGAGGEVGPDLSNVGTLYKRGDLLTSILEPGKTIALGFEQYAIETKSGALFTGAIRRETDDAVTVLGADQQPHIVNKADIKSRKAVEGSIMPAGLTLGLTPGDVADLLAFLESLRGN